MGSGACSITIQACVLWRWTAAGSSARLWAVRTAAADTCDTWLSLRHTGAGGSAGRGDILYMSGPTEPEAGPGGAAR